MLRGVSTVVLLVFVTCVLSSPTQSRQDLAKDVDKEAIREELELLKTKLRNLESSRSDGILLKSVEAHVQPEIQSSLPQEAGNEKKERPLLEKFLRTLTPEGLQILKDLKSVMLQEKVSQTQNSENLGTHDGIFLENPLPEVEEGAKIGSATSITAGSKVSKTGGAEQKLREDIQTYHQGDNIPVKTEEGYFIDLREQIKTAVEKNLLSDIALAVHSGIPVQEIIKDLQFTEDRRQIDRM